MPALVDLSDMVIDPDFVDRVGIVHRTPMVNDMGENTLISNIVWTIGSVQPASGNTLSRLPDALRVANVDSFWVKGVIIADGKCEYPDLLIFKKYEYEVQFVLDWTNWAFPGWCEGTAVRKRISL
jgi:hypothetical protein